MGKCLLWFMCSLGITSAALQSAFCTTKCLVNEIQVDCKACTENNHLAPKTCRDCEWVAACQKCEKEENQEMYLAESNDMEFSSMLQVDVLDEMMLATSPDDDKLDEMMFATIQEEKMNENSTVTLSEKAYVRSIREKNQVPSEYSQNFTYGDATNDKHMVLTESEQEEILSMRKKYDGYKSEPDTWTYTEREKMLIVLNRYYAATEDPSADQNPFQLTENEFFSILEHRNMDDTDKKVTQTMTISAAEEKSTRAARKQHDATIPQKYFVSGYAEQNPLILTLKEQSAIQSDRETRKFFESKTNELALTKDEVDFIRHSRGILEKQQVKNDQNLDVPSSTENPLVLATDQEVISIVEHRSAHSINVKSTAQLSITEEEASSIRMRRQDDIRTSKNNSPYQWFPDPKESPLILNTWEQDAIKANRNKIKDLLATLELMLTESEDAKVRKTRIAQGRNTDAMQNPLILSESERNDVRNNRKISSSTEAPAQKDASTRASLRNEDEKSSSDSKSSPASAYVIIGIGVVGTIGMIIGVAYMLNNKRQVESEDFHYTPLSAPTRLGSTTL